MFQSRVNALPKRLLITNDFEYDQEAIPAAFDMHFQQKIKEQESSELLSVNSNDQRQQKPVKARGPVRLSEVPQGKLIVLTKNRVTKDQPIKVAVYDEQPPWNIKPAKPPVEAAPISSALNESISQNDKLFNQDKILQERRERKQVLNCLTQNFLNTIQNKLEALELEAGELEKDFKQDQQQLLQLNEINTRVNRDLHNYRIDRKVGKLEQQLAEALQKKQKSHLINPVMTAGEINQQLNSLYEENERLFNEIDGKLQPAPSKTITTFTGFRHTVKTVDTASKKKKSRSKSKGKQLTSTLASTLKHPM